MHKFTEKYLSRHLMKVVDLAVSLARVADLDRNLTNEDGAISGFQEAIEHLESLKLDSVKLVWNSG